MKSTSNKHFCCTICQRGFTRIDHLKRHHLRHSGVRPYSCVFCHESFARCDNLRDHYSDCTKRAGRKIPETGQRGRRRHACQSCTSMKLRCDGLSPCGSCQKRNLLCNNGRKDGHNSPSDEASPSSRQDGTPSDRGSIKFLLNGGTDGFTEDFLLPPGDDRVRGLEYNRKGMEDYGDYLGQNEGSQSPPPIEVPDPDPSGLSLFQDSLFELFAGPLGDPDKSLREQYTDIPMQTVVAPCLDLDLALPIPDPMIIEPERPFAINLVDAIVRRVWSFPLDPKTQGEITTMAEFLLTTARIRKYVALYFRYWEPSLAMLHGPTFDPETVPMSLLLGVAFMGAMYSSDEQETRTAKRLLDFAELVVFSNDVFAPENDITATFCGTGGRKDESTDWTYFQNFQAGFVILIVQYWSGCRVSRNRAMEVRFSELVNVARRMGLSKCRHGAADRSQELLWIRRECRIRTMNIIVLLDCAFSFYQNYPCRLAHTELACDMPSIQSLFFCSHPFADPNFHVTRDQPTVYEAFQCLFAGTRDTEGVATSAADAQDTVRMASRTVFDMFILVHLLYSFINTHMTLLGSLLRKPTLSHRNSASEDPNSKQPQLRLPEDSTLGGIRKALTRWHEHWSTLRTTIPSHEWASMGFYKNGYNFWLVSQLMVTKKDSMDVVMNMEVKCEDKLEKLKVLLKDDSE